MNHAIGPYCTLQCNMVNIRVISSGICCGLAELREFHYCTVASQQQALGCLDFPLWYLVKIHFSVNQFSDQQWHALG